MVIMETSYNGNAPPSRVNTARTSSRIIGSMSASVPLNQTRRLPKNDSPNYLLGTTNIVHSQ